MPDTVVGGLSCAQVLEGLGDYLDGRLPTGVVSRVEAHLAGCTRCERFGEGVGEVLMATRRLGRGAPLDPARREAILAALGREPGADT